MFKSLLLEKDPKRTDKTGQEVAVPLGYGYKEGDDGKGFAVPPCNTVEKDRVGRLHTKPPGHIMRMGRNGRGIVIPLGEPTTETKEGQIQRRPNPSETPR